MVTAKDESSRRDAYGWVGTVALMAVLLGVGVDLFLAARAKQALAMESNEIIGHAMDGRQSAAVRRLEDVQETSLNLRQRTAHFWLEKIQSSGGRESETTARVHRSIGMGFSRHQIPELAERHYSLSLVYDPGIEDVIAHLPMECFYTGNYELGWIASQRVRDNPELRIADRLVDYFESNYTGPKDFSLEESAAR